MIWSKLIKQLQGMLCKELSGRVKFISATYRKQHDNPGRVALIIDDKEIIDMSTLKWSNEIGNRISQRNEGNYSEKYNEVECELAEEGIFPQWDFYRAAHEYLTLSIEESINSSNKIINILAVMDRRIGARTLIKLKEKFNNDLDVIKYIINLRLEYKK